VTSLLQIAALALQFGRVDRATCHPDGERPESDTDHTVMLGLLAIDIAHRNPSLGLNPERLALLALVHDLAEVYAGDTNTTGGLTPEQQREKEAREAAAFARIEREIGGGIALAMRRYELQRSPEARFLRYLDKVTPKLTHALNGGAAVRRQGHDLAWLRARHRAQGAELAARYPEFAAVLGPIFDAACEAAESAMEAAEAERSAS
jgi:5'-deoxynucleotidase YfbR-like HD superfamily hydrolase